MFNATKQAKLFGLVGEEAIKPPASVGSNNRSN
jgi:hypothetical protein